MNKSFIVLFLFFSQIVYTQHTISGIVVDNDNIPLIGASILEEGTENGTVTDQDGNFLLDVSDENVILIFAYTGFDQKRVSFKKRSTIKVKLKGCNICWFDAQKIDFFINSGVLNNPIGGKLSLSSPGLYHLAVLKGEISYQTNLKENQFLNINLDLLHLYVDCDFNVDLKSSYRKLDFQENISFTAYSIATDLNFRKLTLILGYSEIDFTSINDKAINSPGVTIGLEEWLAHPLSFKASGKVSIYKDLIEYNVSLNKQFKGFHFFADFYHIKSFTEISIGIGGEVNYLFKKQRHPMNN